MKKGLKIVSVLMMCTILCGLVLACSAPAATSGDAEQNGAAAVEGKWNIESVTTSDGEVVEGEELAAQFGEMYYEFQSGGKFVAGAAGEEVLGSWEQTGAEVTFEIDGESFTALIDGDTLTVENNGGVTVFSRA